MNKEQQEEAVRLLDAVITADEESKKPAIFAYIGDGGAQCVFCGVDVDNPYQIRRAEAVNHRDGCLVEHIYDWMRAVGS